MLCEKFCCWPRGRVATELARLPKPDKPGEHRLIALMHTLIRVRGRVRRPVSVEWEGRHRNELLWGSGPGRSSLDCAFAHNLEAEVARNTGQHCLTVLIDMIKCYELVLLRAVMTEAAAVGFPLRLAWMLVCNYQQPRRIKGFNSLSRSY
eukprot:4067353-Pyramimonas_sp.AAC.1